MELWFGKAGLSCHQGLTRPTRMPALPRLLLRDNFLILAAAAAFGLLVHAILPGRAIAMNDDFGYLRSVLETIQHGRPWTDDFLEPWSLSLVAAAAAIFKVSGSFWAATIGLQTVMAAVSFWLVCRIALDAGCRPLASVGLAAALLTFPTVFWKQVEFTALVVYFPCFFAALWCAGRNRWTWFLLAWTVAVASRPSALAWLALPVIAGAEAAIREKNPARLKVPWLIALLGVGWFFLVRGYANETHAQRFITNQLFSRASLASYGTNLQFGFWILAIATGCASLLFRVLRRPSHAAGAPWAARLGGGAVALGLLATLPLAANSGSLSLDHPFFENRWAVAYLRSLVVLAAAGWILAPPRFRLPFLGAAFAALLLASLRPRLWDYYLIDAALLAFFALRPAEESTASSAHATWDRWLQPAVASVLLLGTIALHLAATGPVKRLVDFSAGANSVLEKALRAGWMKPTELSFAPFGFVGWHLSPYYLTHEGRNSAELGGFNDYIVRDAVEMKFEGVVPDEAEAAMAGRLAPDPARPYSEIHRHGWSGYARFSLVRLAAGQPAARAVDWADYRFVIFPLNDAEWRELAANTIEKK